VAGLLVFFVSCKSIETSRYELKAPALETDPLTIALVTDLHSTLHGEGQSILVEKIKNEKPDLIFLAGDIIVEKAPLDGVRYFLEGIQNLAPIYYVTGNHEYWRQDFSERMNELTTSGVVILSDTYIITSLGGNTLVIAGVNDPDKREYEDPGYDQEKVMEKVFRELDELPYYKILIAHRPERIDIYCRYSFNLIVSGHAHGGQVRLPPFIKNGLYAPHQGLFPKYTGGIYLHGNVTHIVSRGLAVNRPPVPRIFNNPELVIITLEPTEAEDTLKQH
jgi:predicted MPP superfamily phosphohydrolase